MIKYTIYINDFPFTADKETIDKIERTLDCNYWELDSTGSWVECESIKKED